MRFWPRPYRRTAIASALSAMLVLALWVSVSALENGSDDSETSFWCWSSALDLFAD